MAFAVIMPKAGMSMETGRVVRWLKNVGDPVRVGEPLLEIETDKVTMEVEAEASGILTRILCGPGTEVPVTSVIGWLGEPDEAAARGQSERPPAAAALEPTQPVTEAPTPGRPSLPAQGRNRTPATPLARTLARGSGIDIATVKPTGARGEVKARDVLGARERRATEAQSPVGIPLTFLVEADVTDLDALRERVNGGLNARTSMTDWLIRAVGLAIQVHPDIQGEAAAPGPVNIAVSGGGEEPRPVIRDAGSLSVRSISDRRQELAGKARAAALSRDDCAGATFTVTSLESSDVVALTPVLPAGQGAALSAGCIRESLALAAGAVVQRKVIFLGLSRDGRIVSAEEGTRFLATLRALLANPAALLA